MSVAAAFGKSNVLGLRVKPGGGRFIGFVDIDSTLKKTQCMLVPLNKSNFDIIYSIIMMT